MSLISEKDINYTIYGKYPASAVDPNMWLDLRGGDSPHTQHIVVHEFGHALGLGHEHQRSDFWRHISPFIDKDMMKKDTAGRICDWEEDQFLKVEEGTATCYDSHSVMLYW